MKPLTKKQRHKIYILALQTYENKPRYIGLCHVLIQAISIYFKQGKYYKRNLQDEDVAVKLEANKGITFHNQLELLPEILRHKPDSSPSINFWWDTDDRDVRIGVLKQAIEETKP
jgi:hypothetical protein